MKKKSREIFRMQNLIENDRLNVGKEFGDLFIQDFNKLVKDYFDVVDKPLLSVEKNKSGYQVVISFSTLRVKPFSSIG